MSKPTLRVKNTCRQCGSSWSPRGTTTSNMCPECGSQDIEVKTRPTPQKKKGKPVWLLAVGAVLILGGGLAALLYFNREPEPARAADNGPKEQAPAAAESPFKPGDPVRVKARARNVLLADVDVADELEKIRAAGNQASIIQLLKQNRVARIQEGTKATVLGVSPAGVRVKITDGNWTDREGILPADVLEPAG
ncbi:MAG TPA: hypothetical protein VM597_31250 [Gemmataceae bacterium]|nr:hypothetical protein [Gemmataceae bacterium]